MSERQDVQTGQAVAVKAAWSDPEMGVLMVAEGTHGGLSATPTEDWYRGGS